MPQSPTARSRLSATGLLFLLAVAVFFLPYAVPVQPAISDSYATGFNNRAAVLLFLIGGFGFVARTRGWIAAPESRDRPLPGWNLWAVLVCTLAACAVWRHHRWPMLGPEANYALERQFHLDGGQRLYRDFEYIYGPLLLYPGHWLHEALRVSTLAGYLSSLAAQWVIGMAMLWFVLARIDLPTRYRWLLLGFFYLFVLQNIFSDGVNYAPLRSFFAAFCAVVVHRVWRHFRRASLAALCMAVSMGFGMALSPEQGISLVLGLAGYAVLLAWLERPAFPPVFAAAVVAWGALVAGVALHGGEFLSTAASAAGGYNLPLLPSPVNCFLLATYLCAFGLVYRAIRARRLDSVAVPMGLCGIPMLSSALGRCDTGHLSGATPLFVLAAFGIAGRPKLLALWLPLACVFLLHLGPAFSFLGKSAHLVQPVDIAGQASAAATQPQGVSPGPYFAPVAVPLEQDRRPRWAAESGYYFGLTDAVLPRSIQAKADEIRRRRAPRLILPDGTGGLAVTFWSSETDLQQLHSLEQSPWVPRARHSLPSTAPIRDAILQLYRPTAQAAGGWRVWELR